MLDIVTARNASQSYKIVVHCNCRWSMHQVVGIYYQPDSFLSFSVLHSEKQFTVFHFTTAFVYASYS